MNPAARHDRSARRYVRLPILIAALLLVVSMVLTGSGLTGTTQAQAERGAIPSLTLDSSAPGQLVITWETPDPHPTDYRLRWANASLGFLSYKDANEAERGNVYPAGDETTLTLNNLSPGEDYKVQLRARYYNADRSLHEWSGPWTATATARVMDEPAEPPQSEEQTENQDPTATPPPEEQTDNEDPPAALTGLTATSIEHDSLTLTWDDPQATNITGYQVRRGSDADSLSTIAADTGSTGTEYTDTTVGPETTYFYAVLALSQDGEGAQSNTISITTTAEPQSEEETVQDGPPAAPTGLTVARVSHSVLTLTWDDPQDEGITGYRILRGAGADTLSTIEADTGTASTEYTDDTVAPETTYHYAILALSADGDGAQSTALSATTPPAPKFKDQPPRVVARQSSTQALVSNVGETALNDDSFISEDLAQEFVTGSNEAGYTLTSIDLELNVSGVSDFPTVNLFSGSATGTEVAALTAPGTATPNTAAVYTFAAPTGITLAKDISYWVMAEGGTGEWYASGTGQEATPATGWSIADRTEGRDLNSTGAFTLYREGTGALKIRVNGTIIPAANTPATGTPTIGGLPLVGQNLTASTVGIADADGLPSVFTHQWKRYAADGTTFETNIGTNTNTYTLTANEEGKKILVEVSFTDNAGNSEGPLVSTVYPSSGTVTAITLVSNQTQSGDSSASYTRDHGQAFTTGSESNGYTVTGVSIISEDTDNDAIALQICEVDTNIHPTDDCTRLTPPGSFTAGTLVYTAPTSPTLRLAANTTYMVVFNGPPSGTELLVDATTSAGEDTTSLTGWSIRDKFQWYNTSNMWADADSSTALRITITGKTAPPNNPATGTPAISGMAQVGPTLTAQAAGITDPDGLPSAFTYQWKRYAANGTTFEANIGTNSKTYTLTANEEGKRVLVEVSFTDNGGTSEVRLSAAFPFSGTVGAPRAGAR